MNGMVDGPRFHQVRHHRLNEDPLNFREGTVPVGAVEGDRFREASVRVLETRDDRVLVTESRSIGEDAGCRPIGCK